MADRAVIECQGDLPAEWQEKLRVCRSTYVKWFRGKRSLAWAETAAFEDICKCYLAQRHHDSAAAPAD
jgi:hypothetical protein